MSSKNSILYICEHEIRLLSGQWPNLSVCAQMQRSAGSALGDDLRQMMSEVKLKDRSCVLVISRKDSVMKVLSLPSSDPKEIHRMAALQVPVVVPFDAEQVMYQHRILLTRKSGYSDVLLALVMNASIEQYVDAIYGAGLTLKDIYVSFDAFAHYGNKFLAQQLKDKPCCAVVLCGRYFSDMIMFHDGQAVFSYHLSYGRQDITSHAKEFAQAVEAGIRDYEKNDFAQEVAQVFFDSGTPALEGIMSCFTRDQKGVTILNVLEGLPDTVKAFMAKHSLDEAWIPLLGCFDRENKDAFQSFLPSHIHSKKAKTQGRKALAHFSFAFLCLIALTAGLFRMILYKHEVCLNQVNQRLELLAPGLRTLSAEMKFLNTMVPGEEDEHRAVRMIREIYEIFPSQAMIQFFSMREPASFELQGIAMEDQDISAFHAALLASPNFQNVDLKYTTKRKRFKQDYTEFKITMDAVE